MLNTPIALQLYSLRHASKTDFDEVLQAVAGIGYQGVEPFHLFDHTPKTFKTRLDSLGLTLASSHYPWANRTPVNETVDVLGELGLDRAIGGFGPEDFDTPDSLQRTIDTIAELSAALAKHNISLTLHNHWWEYQLLDGIPSYYRLQDALPDIEFEIDTYWAANFNSRSAAEEVQRVAKRTPLLHIKDGPQIQGEPNVALGDGVMDIPSILAAADPDTLQWLIVEFDACATDLLPAVATSHRYLHKLTNIG